MNPTPRHPVATARGPLVLAHRGWRGRLPENTMPAFRAALEVGAGALEIDLALALRRQEAVSPAPAR